MCQFGVDYDWNVGHWNIQIFSVWQESKITREEMVKKMMIIVGQKILLEALDKIHYCVSLKQQCIFLVSQTLRNLTGPCWLLPVYSHKII
jgi:hypothetical protein